MPACATGSTTRMRAASGESIVRRGRDDYGLGPNTGICLPDPSLPVDAALAPHLAT